MHGVLQQQICEAREGKLVVYELLVRDFDAGRNYQSIIDRIDYFKFKINAIELLPVMEFEGNESWGYNIISYGFR
jgi:1,4-alpha-glucan branching enzyme